ncbi:hypothetical protein SAMN05216588_111126 [Pseudomonas flavescens]|uniref:Cation transporter n=1 Tax=Phytopseudomonas flavescens TaxID=29435 RepID=A0A1G8HWH1_9GAMM|nr:DUF6482 family protein [Pseudomonas flavescens]SDI11006.1 hypothetical protein SAMN05216588_111126 [Pseudomonas flavescens]
MTLPELLRAAREGAISELQLISLEGGIYLLQIIGSLRRCHLVDDAGRNVHLRSVEHARDLLQELPEVPLFLMHASAYDEMCGLAGGSRAALRVPVSLRSRW